MISWINFEDKINLNILKILLFEMGKIERLEIDNNPNYNVEVLSI